MYNTVMIFSTITMISGKLIPSHWENGVHVSLTEKCHLPKSFIFQAPIKHVFNLEIGELSLLWNSFS